MKNICYIFGAGASCNALPLVKDLPKELGQFSSGIRKAIPRGKSTIHKSSQVLAEDIQWLAEETAKSLSIDTFAKKLFIQGEMEKLTKLKIILALFFISKQATVLPDKRYDGFFAAILEDTIDSLP